VANDDLARFVDRYTVEYLRTFPHPIERVWKAIVDPAEIGQWFVPPTRWDLREGGAYRFHDDDMSGAILAYEPPRLIRFQDTTKNGPDAWFQFELEPVEGGTRMRFSQHTTPGVAHEQQPPHAWDTCWYPGLLEGWHVAFENLRDLLVSGAVNKSHDRTRERELTDTYRAHVDATLPPAATKEP
jgi:uncharacterized protein YndB with AHSA1/START domain